MSAYLAVAALVLAFAFVHVQLWRVRRRFDRSSKLALTPEQKRGRVRLSMAVTWGFAAAGLAGALAGQHGYYWVTPLVFGVLALGLTRLAKTRLSPERELPNESPEAEKVREPSIWDEPSDSWGFGDKEERF